MSTPKKSKLIPIGMALILAGLFFSGQIAHLAQPMGASTLKNVLMISSDVLRLCFFVGIICAIIGALRNRKMKKQMDREN